MMHRIISGTPFPSPWNTFLSSRSSLSCTGCCDSFSLEGTSATVCWVWSAFSFSLLPEECLQDWILPVKMGFRKSPLIRQLRILEGLVGACLSLRPQLSSLDQEIIASKLRLLESLIESCVLIRFVDGYSAGICVLFAEFLCLQLRVATNNQHYFIPEERTVVLLLQSENAIVLNACAWYVKE